ncbi:Uncharacterised protein (plasmid) [Legionella adelaidensis]|uniref:Transmembrane protein n=1 Tax=Legionella adelaidensis TaxID=45056 RepID=A0A0W0R238_9GAMM|nr:hypothetical protein [Legionella adelaidensis]KTC65140.1 hypothetical protein Lade_1513 [Legionella adelaidensis]VEH85032.1 Uncharacterised protein [Legionella adelaidensis]
MRANTNYLPKIFGIVALGAFLSLGIFYSTNANAANGCGFGYHATAFGRCVPNSPGPWARPIVGNPDCWTNRWGQVRCWR